MSDTSIIIPIMRRTLFSTASPSAVKKSGRTYYTIYNYALFCAKRGLYAISSALAEEIINSNKKGIEYKARIYEAIADKMYSDGEYRGAVNAYQVSCKY